MPCASPLPLGPPPPRPRRRGGVACRAAAHLDPPRRGRAPDASANASWPNSVSGPSGRGLAPVPRHRRRHRTVPVTESHLACHTYPEHRLATFNLYCCRPRPRWTWEDGSAALGAADVIVREVPRGGLDPGRPVSVRAVAPGCGGPVVYEIGSSMVAVCPQCRSSSPAATGRSRTPAGWPNCRDGGRPPGRDGRPGRRREVPTHRPDATRPRGRWGSGTSGTRRSPTAAGAGSPRRRANTTSCSSCLGPVLARVHRHRPRPAVDRGRREFTVAEEGLATVIGAEGEIPSDSTRAGGTPTPTCPAQAGDSPPSTTRGNRRRSTSVNRSLSTNWRSPRRPAGRRTNYARSPGRR